MTIVTPIIAQYQGIKEQYPDCLLFFRLGDFYELFAEDAKIASRELSLVLTSRSSGGGEKTPMCGVPHHAAQTYIARLIERGYNVAVCEQLEDPAQVKRGIVKRDVVRVITPGTLVDSDMLKSDAPNYLAAVWPERKGGEEIGFGIAYTDISTGNFYAGQITGSDIRGRLADEITRITPAELLLTDDLLNDELIRLRLMDNCVGQLTPCPEIGYIRRNHQQILTTQFKVANVTALGLDEMPMAIMAAAMVLTFLEATQKRSLEYINNLQLVDHSETLMIDSTTRRNLELVSTIRGNKQRGSLLWVLDDTLTPMGRRLLQEWMDAPLLASAAVNFRLDAVEELTISPMLLAELRDVLKELQDMRRMITQICYGSAGPKVLLNLKNSLRAQPRIFNFLSRVKAPLFGAMMDNYDTLEDICSLLEAAIHEEAPASPKEPNIIKKGFDRRVDELKNITESGGLLIEAFEIRERERTGIKNLKVGYNKVFGYYIEISKSKTNEAPADYERKQTLVNGERFTNTELKMLEEKVLTAAQQLADLEYELFCQIRSKVVEASQRIIRAGEVCAHLDVLQSFASVALTNNYCRPQVDDESRIIIREGRHPVVEKIIGTENYIPNDTVLDKNNQRMMLITGPNMTGKSTYMRQVALIVLMAHMGSFVPADAAQIGYVDRIFTRVGASDDLAGGQSTFMVEMTETSNILRHATENSLIVLDEIGRGTSTYDGLSIAWAVAEHIIDDACAAKTLFATHYHELAALAEHYELLNNYSIAVKERGSSIVFLHKIVEGAADRSYGIQVAQLAGLPRSVVARAKQILANMEIDSRMPGMGENGQISFSEMMPVEIDMGEHSILTAIREVDLDSISPLDALLMIDHWKKELKNEG